MPYANRYSLTLILKDGKELSVESEINSREPVYPSQILIELSKTITKCLEKNNRFSWEVLEIKIITKLQNTMNYENPSELKEVDFFHYLLQKTEVFFEKSETRKKYPESNWNYAICDTPIQKGRGLFFGLNWGGDDINQQTVYPDANKERNWKFVTNSRPFFRQYLNREIESLNYSNLCFFRSPSMNEFVESDWDLAIPLFKEYINYVNPPWCLMLGKPDTLINRSFITDLERYEVLDGKLPRTKRVFGYTGKLFNRYKFGSVPHTESRISNQARNKIWGKVSHHLLN